MSCATHDQSTKSTGRRLRRAAAALSTACLIAFSGSAWAKSSCYSPAEYDAEQAMRLHTELMVIGLTCNSLDTSRQLFAKYQAFTTKHRGSLLDWEKLMIGHFREIDRSNPTRKFDDFRTVIANEVAQRSALMTPPVFCQTYSDQIDQAMALSGAQLKSFLTEDKTGQIALVPPCEFATAEAPSAKKAGGKQAGSVKPASGKAPAPAKSPQPAKQTKPVKTAAAQ
jgi:hypothetical protein